MRRRPAGQQDYQEEERSEEEEDKRPEWYDGIASVSFRVLGSLCSADVFLLSRARALLWGPDSSARPSLLSKLLMLVLLIALLVVPASFLVVTRPVPVPSVVHEPPQEPPPVVPTPEQVSEPVPVPPPTASQLHDVDKRGPNYALASLGATVVHSMTSPTFSGEGSWWQWVARRWLSGSGGGPEEVLDPDVLPGKCWCFEGARGNITVALPQAVVVTSVTLDHVPKAHAPHIASAPKTCRVWGISASAIAQRTLLAELEYDISDSAPYSQNFAAAKLDPPRQFSVVQLEVLGNHGFSYTCVYHFRVHSARTQDADP